MRTGDDAQEVSLARVKLCIGLHPVLEYQGARVAYEVVRVFLEKLENSAGLGQCFNVSIRIHHSRRPCLIRGTLQRTVTHCPKLS
jgi:hypothetical protein